MPEIYIALQVFQIVWLVGLTLITYMRKPGLEAGAAAKHIEAEFARAMESHRSETQRELRVHEVRLAEIDAHMRHLPTSEHVERIASRTEGLADGMATVRTQLNRIEAYLLGAKDH
jgi:hypothetical protein